MLSNLSPHVETISLQILYPLLPLYESTLPHHLALLDCPVKSTFVRPRFTPRRSPPRTRYNSFIGVKSDGM
jgi:hypothetical protein